MKKLRDLEDLTIHDVQPTSDEYKAIFPKTPPSAYPHSGLRTGFLNNPDVDNPLALRKSIAWGQREVPTDKVTNFRGTSAPKCLGSPLRG